MRAIAFDLDGTLFDHAAAASAAVIQWIDANAWPVRDDAVSTWFAIEDHRFGEYAQGLVGLQEQRRRRVRDFLPFLGIDVASDEEDGYSAQYLALYRANWVGFSDVRETLETLAARGYPIAVLTNGYHEQQRDKLEAIGALDLVDHLLASADLPAFKPDARAYQALRDALGLEAHEIAYVGDDVVADAYGARDAGLRSIHLDRSGAVGPLPGIERIHGLAELLTLFA